jgi:hypothetical protein
MKPPFRITLCLCLALAVVKAMALPTITTQPTNRSVSLGAKATFEVGGTSALPRSYQWRLSSADIAGAITNSLVLTNIQSINGGDYVAVVTDASGSVTSRVAALQVDAAFTKITDRNIVNDGLGASTACAWGDYNNDGWPDLFVNNRDQRNFLYRNNGDGTFERITTGHMVTNVTTHLSGVWGDYNNDGYLDMFAANGGSVDGAQRNFLYYNNGDGTFSQPPTTAVGTIVTDVGGFLGAAWGDYDDDGFLDVFVANYFASNWLYHNIGGTTFERTGGIGSGSAEGAWADYDNDGDLDLLILKYSGGNNLLYRNDGHGLFTRVTTGPIPNEGASSAGGSWGDYDNDGFFDLFVSNFPAGRDLFYRNHGDGTFDKINQSPLVSDTPDTYGAAWADYDNDGFLDLFVCNGFFGDGGLDNYLFHNKGDGTFEKHLTGSLANDQGHSIGCAWADYDNDGFLDLFVANATTYEGGVPENNFLYRNNGNANKWLKVHCVGTVSNRGGIGAKVRVKANYAGQDRWQLRQIASSDGRIGGSLEAHFGLGDATTIQTLRIEWPSGIVQELHDVPVNESRTIVEPAGLQVSRVGAFKIQCWKGMAFEIQTSTNLIDWLTASTITNLAGSLEFADLDVAGQPRRFYRTVLSK